MAENDNQEGAAGSEQSSEQPQVALQRVYIKDSSFEAPNAPQIFQEQWQPQVSMDLNTSNSRVGDNQFEIVLTLTLTAKVGEKTAYIVEVQQAGVFVVRNFPEDRMGYMLGAYCPGIIFPYARESIDNMITKGSFPPLMLAPVNFDAIYRQSVERQEQEQEQGGAEGDDAPRQGH